MGLPVGRKLRAASPKSRYYEQAALEDLVRSFPHFLLPATADVAALYLLPTHSSDNRDHTGELALASDNATVLYKNRPLHSVHAHLIPGPNYARWARHAADAMLAMLLRSAVREDLCAVHGAWCK